MASRNPYRAQPPLLQIDPVRAAAIKIGTGTSITATARALGKEAGGVQNRVPDQQADAGALPSDRTSTTAFFNTPLKLKDLDPDRGRRETAVAAVAVVGAI